MSRDKYPVSVVPYPIDRAPKSKILTVDESAEWDAKWLRPKRSGIQQIAAAPEREERLIQPVRFNLHSITEPEPEIETAPEEPKPALSLRFLRWLFPEVNQRRAKRFPTPGLVAYYWTGGAPYSYHVGDMSATGLFLLTKDRWAPGTLIQMTLQKQDGRTNRPEDSICVLTEVVRWSKDGAGFNFVLSDDEGAFEYQFAPGEVVDRKSVEEFMQKIGVPQI